ncbi:hypothetical protein J4212_08410 [Candidatus Woesearchaeota archaeon]|nr:hypothetical protein [Candidatus Woesearchaeota archaeon]
MAIVTESINQKTIGIDTLSAYEGIERFFDAESEIFDALSTDAAVSQVSSLADKIKDAMENGSKIVIHGAGTSGRFAVFLANYYNEFFKTDIFEGIIAGGYSALVKSKEGSEDDGKGGVRDFLRAAGGAKGILYIGISASGKAKCVQEPLEYIINNGIDADRVLLTFNGANAEHIAEMASTFGENDLVVNPVLGPEAIQGSTRLKAGSATQMILDMAITIAGIKSGKHFEGSSYLEMSNKDIVMDMISNYKYAFNAVLEQKSTLAELAEKASKSLLDGKPVSIMADGLLAPFAVLDAAEMSPTFGARFEEWRAYAKDGWNSIATALQLKKISKKFREKYQIGIEYFADMPKEGALKESGTVISLLTEDKSDADGYNQLKIPYFRPGNMHSLEIYQKAMVKWMLNAVSTEAYVLAGKTWGNLMIDVRIASNKLYERAVGTIIPKVLKELGKEKSRREIAYYLNYAALRDRHEREGHGEFSQRVTSRKYNIKTYADGPKLVAKTLLMLLGMKYETANESLLREVYFKNVIRKAA